MDYLLQSPTIPLWALSDQVNFDWVHVQQAYKRLGFVTLKADNIMEDTYITEDQIKSALKSFPKLNLEDKIIQATSDLAAKTLSQKLHQHNNTDISTNTYNAKQADLEKKGQRQTLKEKHQHGTYTQKKKHHNISP